MQVKNGSLRGGRDERERVGASTPGKKVKKGRSGRGVHVLMYRQSVPGKKKKRATRILEYID